MENIESKTLNETLENYVNPEILERLNRLQAMWLDPELFMPFEKRVLSILQQNPLSEDIIIASLDKTSISLEQLNTWYKREFRTTVNHAVNDDFYWEDLNDLKVA